ncbi:glycerate kinase [Anoxybacterium hadale]|uniref:Glycerate kinase n=1 Tax=Anoxybacterium hadale TaxID=3408580 RepID=A0ACD1AF58_9FIRM|nr:glycerate kinase [Clostridiales bacterium]
MRFVFAPDSFKGSFTSREIIDCLTRYAEKYFPEAELVGIPMADGGEGTVEALISSLGGVKEDVKVVGPMGVETKAVIGYLHDGKTAVLEMAQASGLALAGRNNDPLKATSYGTGQMIRHALDRGVENIVIGIGGSATNDGGMGAMTALGVTFLDSRGRTLTGCGENLGKVAAVEPGNLLIRASEARISVICDVTNPLLGENGATYVYGPQKGVRKDELKALDTAMEHYIQQVECRLGRALRQLPGAGAAGGMGAALSGFLNAELKPGIEVILDLAGFDRIAQSASLVITGEGRIDRQSLEFGKVPFGVMKRCKPHGVPVLILAGSMGREANSVLESKQVSIMTSVNDVMTIEEAMENSEELLESAVERLFLMLKIGHNLR